MPWYAGPDYDFRKAAVAGELGKNNEGALPSADSENRFAYRFELPAGGALIASLTGANPAARLGLAVYGNDGKRLATAEAGRKMETGVLPGGTYWVVVSEPWKDRVETRFALSVLFRPSDPDALSGASGTKAGAHQLPRGNGQVSGRVDYSGMKRTDYWHIEVPDGGGLSLGFDPLGANLVAEILGPSGPPEKIDPAVGYRKEELPGGDYFVKVYASGPGDAGRYRLSSEFRLADTCRNGGAACKPEGAEPLELPQDSKTADVDFNRAKQHHYYRASLSEKGRLTIAFKVLDPARGSKVQALFLRGPDQPGERIVGSATKDIEAPGDYFVEVTAPQAGDFATYALQTTWQPANFVSGEMVELGRNPCMLTVQAGTNQGVRTGAPCTIVVGNNPAAIDSCVVDRAFPNLSKVRPLGVGCHIPNQNVKVQISQ
jgi:hypothetical protein